MSDLALDKSLRWYERYFKAHPEHIYRVLGGNDGGFSVAPCGGEGHALSVKRLDNKSQVERKK